MKKFIAVFLMLFMIASLCACGNDGNDTSADSKTESADSLSTETSKSDALSSEEVSGGYTVTVVDGENKPVANAILQLCKLGDDGNCTPGNPTDAEGKVEFNLPEDEYKVSFVVMPAGYTYSDEAQEFYFEEGKTELTITLAKAD